MIDAGIGGEVSADDLFGAGALKIWDTLMPSPSTSTLMELATSFFLPRLPSGVLDVSLASTLLKFKTLERESDPLLISSGFAHRAVDFDPDVACDLTWTNP